MHCILQKLKEYKWKTEIKIYIQEWGIKDETVPENGLLKHMLEQLKQRAGEIMKDKERRPKSHDNTTKKESYRENVKKRKEQKKKLPERDMNKTLQDTLEKREKKTN